MKITIQANKEEKQAMALFSIALLVFLYFYNRRYFYVIDAVFHENTPKSIILKTGFIFPVKTEVLMQDGWSKKIKIYGNVISVVKSGDNFDVLVNDKKITTIYTDDYYEENKKLPTGRVKYQ